MVAVLVTNLVPNMGQFLPPSINGAYLGTKMVPSVFLSCDHLKISSDPPKYSYERA